MIKERVEGKMSLGGFFFRVVSCMVGLRGMSCRRVRRIRKFGKGV